MVLFTDALLDSDLAEKATATNGHAIGCSCMVCYRERKLLRDEAEADYRADMEASLPPVKEEARALFEMIGRNGDSVESIRELFSVPPKIEVWLLEQTRHSPRGRRGIEKVLRFRRRVLEEFERLITDVSHASPSPPRCPTGTFSPRRREVLLG